MRLTGLDRALRAVRPLGLTVKTRLLSSCCWKWWVDVPGLDPVWSPPVTERRQCGVCSHVFFQAISCEELTTFNPLTLQQYYLLQITCFLQLWTFLFY